MKFLELIKLFTEFLSAKPELKNIFLEILKLILDGGISLGEARKILNDAKTKLKEVSNAA